MHSTRFVDYLGQTVQALVHWKLLRVAENVVKLGNCIDLPEVLLRFPFDNICTAAFRINPGCLSIDFPEVAFAKAFEEATELTLIRFMVSIRVEANEIFSIGIREEAKGSWEKRSEHNCFHRRRAKDNGLFGSSNIRSLKAVPTSSDYFKEVTNDDLFADGTQVEKDARVIYSIFSMARMESVWGKDCLEFKPGRWIKNGEFVCENQFRCPVFNAGPRLCVGKKFAYMQMTMVAGSVIDIKVEFTMNKSVFCSFRELGVRCEKKSKGMMMLFHLFMKLIIEPYTFSLTIVVQ
ncbi:hypothetical protein Vadar_026009 [Vaccinium darrowii]|uniref:Uncharacterized protein n=1 Tax=Vaccinium darrowii TaxID=229202 RepID=A0ACB7YZC6_9ERIC|nr:hypothetical protein Vadar_026009 [Vaccinium darrowii]